MNELKFRDIQVLNKLGMYDYYIASIEEDDLILHGDRGYPQYYRVIVRFIETVYVDCSFRFAENMRFSVAKNHEKQAIEDRIGEEVSLVFCIDEDVSGYLYQLKRAPLKFFIAAEDVEIIVRYSGEDIEKIVPEINQFEKITSEINEEL